MLLGVLLLLLNLLKSPDQSSGQLRVDSRIAVLLIRVECILEMLERTPDPFDRLLHRLRIRRFGVSAECLECGGVSGRSFIVHRPGGEVRIPDSGGAFEGVGRPFRVSIAISSHAEVVDGGGRGGIEAFHF